jgi:NAD-dependent deacetylase
VHAPIALDDRTRLLVLTGAGVSAESGVPTFRGMGGLWRDARLEELASPEGFAKDPAKVWRFYSERRERARACAPNPGHHALAAIERRLKERFLLATQNVDGLHRRAGSERLIELHGNLFQTRCMGCRRPPFEDEASHAEGALPVCELCAAQGRRALLRPAVVWFGELLEGEHLRRLESFLHGGPGDRLVFLAAGTSGAVWPAAGLVHEAKEASAQTWLLNADPAENTGAFDVFVQGKSGELLPGLLGV